MTRQMWLVERTDGTPGVSERTVEWWLVPPAAAAGPDEACEYVFGRAGNDVMASMILTDCELDGGTGANVPADLG